MTAAGVAFPREVSPGIHWLSGCTQTTTKGRPVHSYTSPFLLRGTRSSVLVDTGAAPHWEKVDRELDIALAGEPLTYIFPTHAEQPHIGNLPLLARKYPQALICGNLRSCHLFYPELVHRMLPKGPGDTLDIGGSELVFIDAAIRDLPDTLWGYDTSRRALFVSDGLGFSHDHDVGECGLLAEELPLPPTPEHVALLNDTALHWFRFTEIGVPFVKLDAVLAAYPPDIILPAHGSVITDPVRMVPVIKRGMVVTRERTLEEIARALA